MTDKMLASLTGAAEQLYSALLVKQADAPGRARARRMGTYGKAAKPKVPPVSAAPAAAASEQALPKAPSMFKRLLTPRNAALVGGAALLGGAGYGAYRLAKGKETEAAEPATLMKSAAKTKAVQTMRRYKTQGVPEAKTTWAPNAQQQRAAARKASIQAGGTPPRPVAKALPAPASAKSLPAPAAAPRASASVVNPAEVLPAPKKPLVPPRIGGTAPGAAPGPAINVGEGVVRAGEGAASKGMSRLLKGGLIGAGLGLAGYGAYKLMKGKDKSASTVGQLSTAPQEGAPTPPMLSALIKAHAKDHPGMKHPMPTDPGPAYPHLLKAQPGISLPLMGKAASAGTPPPPKPMSVGAHAAIAGGALGVPALLVSDFRAQGLRDMGYRVGARRYLGTIGRVAVPAALIGALVGAVRKAKYEDKQRAWEWGAGKNKSASAFRRLASEILPNG